MVISPSLASPLLRIAATDWIPKLYHYYAGGSLSIYSRWLVLTNKISRQNPYRRGAAKGKKTSSSSLLRWLANFSPPAKK